MDTGVIRFFIWVVAIVIVYALASRGLFRATNSLRESLVDLSDTLVKDRSFPEKDKKRVFAALDDVHSARAAWRLTLSLTLCVLSFAFLWQRVPDVMKDVPRKLQPTFDTFISRWILATISNSVLASLIFVIVLVIAAAFSSSIHLIVTALIGGRRSLNRHEAHAA